MTILIRSVVVAAIGLICGFTLLCQPVEAVDDSSSVRTGDGVHVVELFTSEGCSSCPPADAVLTELAERDDVIALSFHVDYWNRLGWKDPFSFQGATDRQSWYARLFGSNRVYTPQIVIGGVQETVGSRRSEVEQALANGSPINRPLDVQVIKRGDVREVSVQSNAELVNIALVQPRATMDVERGENGGRTLSHTNVVRDFSVVRPSNGIAKATLQIPRGVYKAFVVAYAQSATGAVSAVALSQ